MPPTALLAPCQPPTPPLPVQAFSGQELYYCRSAWHVISLWVRLMFCQMYTPPLAPMSPQCPPGRAIWWPRMVLILVQLISAHVLLSAIDCFEFSRVLCNSSSSYFICNPQYPLPAQCPLIPLHYLLAPWCTLHPCWHLVTKSNTTSGQLDIWSAFWSGWPVYWRVYLMPAARVIPASSMSRY